MSSCLPRLPNRTGPPVKLELAVSEMPGSGGPVVVLKYSSDEVLGSGSPALVLKSSSDFGLASMAQADVAGKLGRRLPIVSRMRSPLTVVHSRRLK